MPRLLTPHLRETLDNDFAEDWSRQRRTAEDVLQRLQSQEGVVLADQVGMGKTFVALAVAVSQLLAEPTLGQVVVLVPARVGDKWIKEWGKFSEALLLAGAPDVRCVDHVIRSGEEFLKALDDPPERRSHIVVVTYEALTANLKDSFIQLALLYFATRNRTGAADIRRRIARWSTGRSGLISDSRLRSEQVERLLNTPPAQWREVWSDLTGEDLGDDPVPAALIDVATALDLTGVWEAIQSLPVNSSANLDARLKAARKSLIDATQSVWKIVLTTTKPRMPLLIVDEAHSLKNSRTRISRLFTPLPGESQDGALKGIFDRMLLLTATPFELGHDELINVLGRLDAVRPMRPKPAESLSARLDQLKDALGRAQATALELDASWGRISLADLDAFDTWLPDAEPPTQLGAHGRKAWRDAQLAVQARWAMNQALKPWVIRHSRPARRRYHLGAAILPGHESPAGAGLEIGDEAALPFLLAARAQAVAEQHRGATRPLFAYGIASSYEAFLRLGGTEVSLDSDGAEDDETTLDETPIAVVGTAATAEVRWYRDEIERVLGHSEVRAQHPKVAATAERALQLWLAGEKCLIFCWYIRSTAALQGLLEARLGSLIIELAAKALDVPVEHADDELSRIADRLLKSETANHARIRGLLVRDLVAATSNDELAGELADAVIRNLRTPSYLVRYTHLSADLDMDGLYDGIRGKNPLGIDVLDRWLQFAKRLAISTSDDRQGVLNALLGEHGHDGAGSVGRGARLSPVRRAYGGTRREDRKRLIDVFNTPFAPDILIASSVMGEGIDLHQECRHVIHHDLDWNPSKLEQRTGRLDRIGAFAERVNEPIEVFEPFLAGTHDEKMFRVVKDRAAWFDVVMGRAAGADEHETDAEETRLPLHPRIRDKLSMDLTSPK